MGMLWHWFHRPVWSNRKKDEWMLIWGPIEKPVGRNLVGFGGDLVVNVGKGGERKVIWREKLGKTPLMLSCDSSGFGFHLQYHSLNFALLKFYYIWVNYTCSDSTIDPFHFWSLNYEYLQNDHSTIRFYLFDHQ